MLFLVPIAGTVHAVNPNPYTLTATSGNPMLGATALDALGFTLSNPTSNTYAVTIFLLTAPTGFTITGWTAPAGCTIAAGGISVTCGTTGAPLNIVPGGSLAFAGTVTAPAPTGTNVYPVSYTWTSEIQDQSSVGYSPGPSLSTMTMDPHTAVAVTNFAPLTYIAGSAALTMTATVTQPGGQAAPQAGLPITWTITGGTLCYLGLSHCVATYTGGLPSIGASSSTNGAATNTATTSFSPSDESGDSAHVTATVGTSAVAGATLGALTTNPGSPASVVWTRSTGTSFSSSKTIYISGNAACGGAGSVCFGTPTFAGAAKGAEYVGGPAGLAVAAADAFGNTYGSGIGYPTSGPMITINAPTGIGVFDNGGLTGLTSASCTTGMACAATGTTGTGTVSLNYFQTYAYGTSSILTAVINGIYNTVPFSVSALSGTIITGNEAVAVTELTTGTLVAGTVDTFTATLGNGVGAVPSTQPGVPVTFELCIHAVVACAANTPAGYGTSAGQGSFTTGGQSVTVGTLGPSGTGAGTAVAKYTLDQAAGVTLDFNATIPQVTLAGVFTTATTGNYAVGPTVAGPAAGLVVNAFFDTANHFAVGTSLATGVTPVYVCVGLVDQYGNPTTNTLAAQIQVTLTPSVGSLTTGVPYIASGSSSTCALGSFGNDQWNLPTTLALGTVVTLKASATLSGATPNTNTLTTTIVSQTPTIKVVSSPAPLSGWIYSSTGAVTFTTSANVSAGLSGAVTIASIGYKVNNNPWHTAATPAANKNVGIFTSLFFSAGVSTVAFNATDSTTAANTVVSPTFSVLVDTSPPVITATTTAGSSLTNGAPVVFSVVDSEGDLNATSVTANYNGTAVASTAIAITGTNNPGHSVTYTVSVTGIPTGHWSVTLNAKSLAELAATPVSVLVHVIVPFATSVVISGTPTKTTIGGFTGISATYTNNWSTSQNLIVFAVWKNSAGQTVAVTTSGLTLAAGASGTAFAPLTSPPPSGSYTVNVFVWTTNNLSVSSTTSISASV